MTGTSSQDNASSFEDAENREVPGKETGESKELVAEDPSHIRESDALQNGRTSSIEEEKAATAEMETEIEKSTEQEGASKIMTVAKEKAATEPEFPEETAMSAEAATKEASSIAEARNNCAKENLRDVVEELPVADDDANELSNSSKELPAKEIAPTRGTAGDTQNEKQSHEGDQRAPPTVSEKKMENSSPNPPAAYPTKSTNELPAKDIATTTKTTGDTQNEQQSPSNGDERATPTASEKTIEKSSPNPSAAKPTKSTPKKKSPTKKKKKKKKGKNGALELLDPDPPTAFQLGRKVPPLSSASKIPFLTEKELAGSWVHCTLDDVPDEFKDLNSEAWLSTPKFKKTFEIYDITKKNPKKVKKSYRALPGCLIKSSKTLEDRMVVVNYWLSQTKERQAFLIHDREGLMKYYLRLADEAENVFKKGWIAPELAQIRLGQKPVAPVPDYFKPRNVFVDQHSTCLDYLLPPQLQCRKCRDFPLRAPPERISRETRRVAQLQRKTPETCWKEGYQSPCLYSAFCR
jgi:hypothetical protein